MAAESGDEVRPGSDQDQDGRGADMSSISSISSSEVGSIQCASSISRSTGAAPGQAQELVEQRLQRVAPPLLRRQVVRP